MKKILLIDDELDLVEMVKFALEKNNYQVLTATNGEEGLKKVIEETPDLIVMDYMMPELDGLSLVKALDKFDHLRNIPAIIMTGKDHVVKDFIVKGRCQIFSKPFELHDLIKRIGILVQ